MKPKLLVKYDYTNQQLKIEPTGEVSDQELLKLGQAISYLFNDNDYDKDELDKLNTKLVELDQKLRDVQSVIQFLRYGGGQNQKDTRNFNDSFLDTDGDRDGDGG